MGIRAMLNKLFLFFLIGVMCMCGCAKSITYQKYSSTDPQLNITMDYISGWRYVESRGSYGSYAQVQFIGPARIDGSFSASTMVTVQKDSKVKFKPLTIEKMADVLVLGRLKFKDSEVVSMTTSKVLENRAVDIKLNYMALDKLDAVDAKLIPARERIVIFKRDDKFYTLKYKNRAEEFDKLDTAFTHCIESLRFK